MGNPRFSSHRITFFSMMAATAAILQISAGLFPGIGHFLSVFGTLPIALVAALSPAGGLLTYTVTTLMIFLIQPLEMPIFALTTGPFGWMLGWCYYLRRPRREQLFLTTFILFLGMIFLTFIVGMPALGNMIWGSKVIVVITFAIFAFFYSTLWQLGMPYVWNWLNSIPFWRQLR